MIEDVPTLYREGVNAQCRARRIFTNYINSFRYVDLMVGVTGFQQIAGIT